jgi:hypothetical protein
VLHIKLPKGKVATACERAAEQCSKRIAVANDRYRSELERWRKSGGDFLRPGQCDQTVLIQDRETLHSMADMAKHSTGDVYVSPELWNIIKGVY